MDVQAVLAALAAAAATARSTPARAVKAYDYWPDEFETPCVYPERVLIDFDQTMNRGLDKLTVDLRLLVSRIDDREGQRQLWGFLKGAGPSSVKAAIEAARGEPGELALGGAADDLRVTGVGAAEPFEHKGDRLLGVLFTVEIYGSGS